MAGTNQYDNGAHGPCLWRAVAAMASSAGSDAAESPGWAGPKAGTDPLS
jgi:hypothetical protein